MATLSKADREALWGRLMSDVSREHEVVPIDKKAFKARVDGVDDALDAAFASFLATMPQAFGTVAARKMAHRMFRDAAKVRAEKGV